MAAAAASGDHTETVQIQFDPEVTAYPKLLEMFWDGHNCTQKRSRQYMSAIFFHDQLQKKQAEESRDERQKKEARRIVTRIEVAGKFYDAEL